jgi:beta-phosphoglucomutase-like phosphatase (HAD superfamily)
MVLFDNNGTIFDDLDIAFGSVVRIFQSCGLTPPNKKQYRQEISADYMKFYHKYGIPSYHTPEKEKQLARVLNDIRESYYIEYGSSANFRPDVARTVCTLKSMNIGVGIVSAEKSSMFQSQINRFGYVGIFNPIYTDVHNKQIAFEEICKNFNINPGSVIYVDDTVDGTSAAKRAGLISVAMLADGAYNSPERLSEVTPYGVERLYDLVGLIDFFNNRQG